MTTAGWLVAGEDISIPEDSDVLVTLTIKQAVDGAAPAAVNLTGVTEIFFTVLEVRGTNIVNFSTLDASSRVTVVSAANGIISVQFRPADFPGAKGYSYRVTLRTSPETAGKPYGTGQFTVYAT